MDTNIKFIIISLLAFLSKEAKSQFNQPTYQSSVIVTHKGTSGDNPLKYQGKIRAMDGYYISGFEVNNDNGNGCRWCQSILPQVDLLRTTFFYRLKCNGLPCEVTFTAKMEKMIVSENIRIYADPETLLSSNIWAENNSSVPLELVYRFRSESDPQNYQYRRITIPAYTKSKIMDKYKLEGQSLIRFRVKAMYTRPPGLDLNEGRIPDKW